MNVHAPRATSVHPSFSEDSSPESPRRIPSLHGEPPCIERTTLKRTNDPGYMIRVVDRAYADGRIARSSYLIEVATGKGEDGMEVVSYDGGATWERH